MIGHPLPRTDGLAKVTGAARYTLEHALGPAVLQGWVVGASIGRGVIRSIDTARAEAAPGVVRVLTHHNAPAQAPYVPTGPRFFRGRPVLQSAIVHYYGEPVALVVAATWEQARAAAMLLDIRYEAGPAEFDLRRSLGKAYAPKTVAVGYATDTARGDVVAALASAHATVEGEYEMGYQCHNAMEPHATVARWDGNDLVVHTSAQTLLYTRTALAATFAMPVENVRVVSEFVGGGFGGKLALGPDAVLAALAAKAVRRPVAVALTRPQLFQAIGRRPAVLQHVRLGADGQGRLVGMLHEAVMSTARYDEFAEQTATAARSLYAVPHQVTRHRLVPLDLRAGEPMRGPGEAPGLLAIECTMDDLAHRLGLDPVELRIRNEPGDDPDTGKPFSNRRMVDCLREGAARFGWRDRPITPASRRAQGKLIGWGMAAAIRPHFQGATEVRVRLEPDGTLIVLTDMTDIGTGTYTILTQIAAQKTGLPMARVRVQLGDSVLPQSSGSGGSWGAANTGTALARACDSLAQVLAGVAAAQPDSPLYGGDPQQAKFAAGQVRIGEAAEALEAVVRRAGGRPLEAQGECLPMGTDPNYAKYAFNTYGAQFAEVAVDPDTGEIEVRRMLGVFDAGRIFNPKTAESQMTGAMIWGLSAALFEDAWIDPRYGAVINQNLADYHFPANADVGSIQAVLLGGHDENANPLGARGIGELGMCGSAAAVANAVFNATGVRVRSFPITLDKVLAGLGRVPAGTRGAT